MSNVDGEIRQDRVDTLTNEVNERPQRARVLTERGAGYRIEQLTNEYLSKRRACRKQINKSGSILADENTITILQDERNQVHVQMENLMTAYSTLMKEVEQVDELRELIETHECLEEELSQLVKQFNDRILELRRASSDFASSRSKSLKLKAEARTVSSKSSKSKNSSSKHSETAAKEARLKTELKFIDLEIQKEAELKRIKITKELAMIKAEADATSNEKLVENVSCKEDFELPREDISGELLNFYLQSQVELLQSAPPDDFISNVSAPENLACNLEQINAESRAEVNRSQHSSRVRGISNLPNSTLNPGVVPFTLDRQDNLQSREPPTPHIDLPSAAAPFYLNSEAVVSMPTRESNDREVEEPLRVIPLNQDNAQPELLSTQAQHQLQEQSLPGQGEPTTDPLDPIRRLADVIVQQGNAYALPHREPDVFKGDPLQYPTWVQSFESIVEAKVNEPSHRLYYLQRYTDGEAKEAIRGFIPLNTKEAYVKAKKLLSSRYGNPFTVADSYRKKIDTWPKIQPNDSIGLRKYSDFLLHCQAAMETTGYLNILNDPNENKKMVDKLPRYIVARWGREVDRCLSHDEQDTSSGHEVISRYPSFLEFCAFLKKESRIACNPVLSTRVKEQSNERSRVNRVDRKERHEFGSFATDTKEVKEKNEVKTRLCFMCKEPHQLDVCQQLLKLSLKQRKQYLQSRGLCFGCLSWGHISKNCHRKNICTVCKKFHPTCLHDSSYKPEKKVPIVKEGLKVCNEATEPLEAKKNSDERYKPDEVTSSRVDVGAKCSSHSLIVPVSLYHKDNPAKTTVVYAVLDEQSDACFIKKDVLEHLGIDGPKIELSLSTVLATEVVESQRIDGLVMRGIKEKETIFLPRTYTRDHIPAKRSQIPRPETAEKWNHLQEITNQLVPYLPGVKIGLLIGINCIRAIKPKEIIPGNDDEPYAQRTTLGWGIVGAIDPGTNYGDDSEVETTCHRISCREVFAPQSHKICHFTTPAKTKEVFTPSHVKRMFELDFIEAGGSDEYLSMQDKLFLHKVMSGIERCDDGHYEIPLPFKTRDVVLPNNRSQALSRLDKLRRRLMNDPQYKGDYLRFMDDLIDKGHAEKVLQHELNRDEGKIWYLPHHGVYHQRKPEKIRVVFDCRAEHDGQSLNRYLLSGPDLTNNLVGVLCRFRQQPVAFMCDIEAMFHQVRVVKEHRDYLRFLWWENGEIHLEPVEYRMTVHLFGATSSPGCANFALKKVADDFEAEFGPEVARFIRDNFYVDDGLKSVADTNAAIDLIRKSKELCQKGGFKLHKFISNRKEVIQNIPKIEQAKGIQDLDLSQNQLPIERALGVQWCVESDTLQFRIEVNDRPLTRRGILSTVSSVFDPLGLVAPFILIGKRILQRLCRGGVDWDERVPEDARCEWEKWRQQLHLLTEVEIQRCYVPEGFTELCTVELHNFSDASQFGYGQCSYLRLVDKEDNVHCTLVMGKSRVAPLKIITIPRLELTAALVSSKISSFLCKELKYVDIKEFFWTDSRVVLGYIANDVRRFHVFVANRVEQIKENTSPDQWHYIATKDNPADPASRGLSAKELVESTLWWKGPSFLWSPLPIVQSSDEEINNISKDDPEVKKVCAGTIETPEVSPLSERLQYFSDWHKAKRAIAVCLRLAKDKGNSPSITKKLTYHKVAISTKSGVRFYIPVDNEELRRAEHLIITSEQMASFKKDIEVLRTPNSQGELDREGAKRHRTLSKGSPISRLDPFVDHQGVLRVGGRVTRATMLEGVKHPVILPKRGHITQLVIRYFHERVKHQGRSITLNDVRSSGFWIIGASSAVAYYISKCVVCRRLRAQIQRQKMADLPRDRMETHPPFTYAAVDYFGPWLVKEGRKELKRYGVLFTCMSSRAVHIETSNSLTTDSFINAYRRFVGRRGPIRQLRSDQGTNFIGAKSDLGKALNEMDDDKIRIELLKSQCDWIKFEMNVPYSSHMGGAWERQIRSVRNVLDVLLKNHGQQLDDELLRTLLVECEAIVNSRPLTVQHLNSPGSPEPLSPSNLLTMKSRVLLSPPGVFQRADLYARKRWRRVQHLANEFWSRWKAEFLLSQQERTKWIKPMKNLKEGDVVIIKDATARRNAWPLARVDQAFLDEDGYVRKVRLKVATTSLDDKGKRMEDCTSYVERPIHKLVLLFRPDE